MKSFKESRTYWRIRRWIGKLVHRYRCDECGDWHIGKCELTDILAWTIDCALDALDEYLNIPPEPGSKRWLIERGELRADG